MAAISALRALIPLSMSSGHFRSWSVTFTPVALFKAFWMIAVGSNLYIAWDLEHSVMFLWMADWGRVAFATSAGVYWPWQ